MLRRQTSISDLIQGPKKLPNTVIAKATILGLLLLLHDVRPTTAGNITPVKFAYPKSPASKAVSFAELSNPQEAQLACVAGTCSEVGLSFNRSRA